MTKDALLSAFGGESMANIRYLIFSEIAEKEGFPNISRLFKAIAYAEFVHAKNHYNRLRAFDEDAKVYAGAPIGPGTTSKNLLHAINGEEYEVNEMYPVFMEIAKLQGDEGAVRSFRYAYEAEKIHAKLYREARAYVEKKEDYPIKGHIWICRVCGHTYIGDEAPEKCPVCNAGREAYRSF
jgi:rubrerythrin